MTAAEHGRWCVVVGRDDELTCSATIEGVGSVQTPGTTMASVTLYGHLRSHQRGALDAVEASAPDACAHLLVVHFTLAL